MSNTERTSLLPLRRTRHSIKSMLIEFKNFIDKGNIFDLAIGVVIGNAFSSIVTSFVTDIFSPLLGLIVSSKLSETFLVLKKGPHFPYLTRDEAKGDGAVTWNYGNFLQIVLNFILISISLFLVMKTFDKMRKNARAENTTIIQDVIDCPFCYSKIDVRSKKCKECTADLNI